jgi:outer membrane protein assembly factor BamD
LFLKFDSYQLGINSVPAKMEERLNVAKQHIQFDKVQADTKYKEQAYDMLS